MSRQRPSTDDPADAVNSDDDHDPETLAADSLVLGYPSSDEPVVDGESLVVPEDSVTALVGPNGSGKSTLLSGLADQLTPDGGAVYLDGTDVSSLDSKELARRLGLLSQNNTAPGELTVQALVERGRYPHQGFLDSLGEDDHTAIETALETAGVDHLRDRPVGNLSGGQQQLVWLAMTLAQETDVLLLDEPTTHLDLHHQLRVLDAIERVRDSRDATVVVVLHDLEQAADYADHLVAMADGAVHARGPPREVVTETLLERVFGVAASVEWTDESVSIRPTRALE